MILGLKNEPKQKFNSWAKQHLHKKKLLYSFLCSINYYRNLIPKYGSLSYDLYAMADSQPVKCAWTKKTLSDFAQLKQAFVSAPILSFPDFQ